jgi:hypothetical protein
MLIIGYDFGVCSHIYVTGGGHQNKLVHKPFNMITWITMENTNARVFIRIY